MRSKRFNPHLPQWVAIYMLIVINAALAGGLYHAAAQPQTSVSFPLAKK